MLDHLEADDAAHVILGLASDRWRGGTTAVPDEYRPKVYPVRVGGGIPFCPRRQRRVDLDLVETRTFSPGVVHLRYRVAR